MKSTNIVNEKLINDCLKLAKIDKWDWDFGKRLWTTDFLKIEKRLEMIGYINHNHVIDAGSGFGHWAYILSKSNKKVTCIEPDERRIDFCNILFDKLMIKNVQFINAKVDDENLIINPANALFCYSVLYLTDYKTAINNFSNWLQKEGLLYINCNDLGWYFYNLANDHNSNDNFSSKQMAAEVIYNAIEALKNNELISGNPFPIPRKDIISSLKSKNFDILASGPDGSTNIVNENKLPFFIDQFLGYEAVYEVYGRKN